MSLPFTIQLEHVHTISNNPIPLVTIFLNVESTNTVKTTSDENTQNINSMEEEKKTSPFKSDRKIGGP